MNSLKLLQLVENNVPINFNKLYYRDTFQGKYNMKALYDASYKGLIYIDFQNKSITLTEKGKKYIKENDKEIFKLII